MENKSIESTYTSKDTKKTPQNDDNDILLLEIDKEGFVRSIKHLPVKESI